MKIRNKIIFSKPYVSKNANLFIDDVLKSGFHQGDGKYTQLCHAYFESRYKIPRALLTTSCTDALEMCSILLDIKYGDEVILPSYTFVSTALPFAQRGAKLVFVDSSSSHPNMCLEELKNSITNKTKAIVVVHYAGIAIDMDELKSIAGKIPIIEDAAHSIESDYKGKQLGTIGTLGTFSFHSTKNISCGEGGLLSINDPNLIERAEIIREKGTNRTAFFRGEVDKYGWVDTGSSFLPSEFNAAILYSQLEELEYIQNKRIKIWNYYYNKLKLVCDKKKEIYLPSIPEYAKNNAHMFFLLAKDEKIRSHLIESLRNNNAQATFHYQALHASSYAKKLGIETKLPNAEFYSDSLMRLPLHLEITKSDVDLIVSTIDDNSK